MIQWWQLLISNFSYLQRLLELLVRKGTTISKYSCHNIHPVVVFVYLLDLCTIKKHLTVNVAVFLKSEQHHIKPWWNSILPLITQIWKKSKLQFSSTSEVRAIDKHFSILPICNLILDFSKIQWIVPKVIQTLGVWYIKIIKELFPCPQNGNILILLL